jgi:hypothetical protein
VKYFALSLLQRLGYYFEDSRPFSPTSEVSRAFSQETEGSFLRVASSKCLYIALNEVLHGFPQEDFGILRRLKFVALSPPENLENNLERSFSHFLSSKCWDIFADEVSHTFTSAGTGILF